MTVWTREQISQVSNLRTSADVDLRMDAQARIDIVAATREKLARAFVAEARPYAVEAHVGDLQFRETEQDEAPWALRVECGWSPQTNEIELRGGPCDGEVMAWRDIGQPIRIPVAQPIDWANPPTEPTEIGHIEIRYVLAGWNEESRRWVYDQEPTR